MKITLLDYSACNVASVERALQRRRQPDESAEAREPKQRRPDLLRDLLSRLVACGARRQLYHEVAAVGPAAAAPPARAAAHAYSPCR